MSTLRLLSGLCASLLWAASLAADDAPAIKVTVIDAKGFQQAVAKHKGKVVLVDCWATWCVPCVREFPKTLELAKQHRDAGLVVLSLSFDDPVDGAAPKKVQEFLQKRGATIENYVSALDLADDGADAFGIAGGALPHFKLYGRDGKLLRTFSSGDDEETFSHADIAQAVAAALQAK